MVFGLIFLQLSFVVNSSIEPFIRAIISSLSCANAFSPMNPIDVNVSKIIENKNNSI